MNPAHNLFVSIVPHGDGQAVAAAANTAGAGGGTALTARGTASSALLQLLGLGDSSKDVVLTVAPAERAGAVREAVRAATARRPHAGVLFRIDVPHFARSGDAPQPSLGDAPISSTFPSPAMENEPERDLITVIVNKGYAEDAMAAARRAGAKGGTVLAAHGTARPDDAAFFGVPIVPEKDVLLILAEAPVAGAVFEAVRSLPCLAERGSGIVFRVPVRDVAQLGR